MRPAAPSSTQVATQSESTHMLGRADRAHGGLATKTTHPLLNRPRLLRLQATMSLCIGAGVAPHNGLELSKIPRCWWEAARRKQANSHRLYARLAGVSSSPEGAARRPKVPGVLPGGSAEGPAEGPAEAPAFLAGRCRRGWSSRVENRRRSRVFGGIRPG
jgi:hypothetical protein